ncbi:MAG: radical SAM protein [Sandaracinaceae bacterium]|nr:radical SAM protein [Sandaracinaceae bacterium]
MTDLGDALLALLAPLAPGDTLLGATLRGASTELGLRLTFEDAGGLVHVEVFPDEPGTRHAARSARLLFAYRALGTERARGEALCRAVAERARVNEDSVLDSLGTGDRAARVREVQITRALEPAGTAERPYLTLSPYVGCLIGCRFCYAQERVGVARRLRGLAPAPWGSYVDARVNVAAVLARELAEVPPHPIKLCPIVSDPYHAIEARLRLTRACLEVLRDAAPRDVYVLTRARLVERDADVLAAMSRARVGFSLPTIDDAVRARFEPRAASIAERLDVLRALRARGVATFAVVQPVLPGDLDALADALAEVAGSVSLDVLRGEGSARADFDAHPEARDEAWQRDRVLALRAALDARGVPRWEGELPADAPR